MSTSSATTATVLPRSYQRVSVSAIGTGHNHNRPADQNARFAHQQPSSSLHDYKFGSPARAHRAPSARMASPRVTPGLPPPPPTRPEGRRASVGVLPSALAAQPQRPRRGSLAAPPPRRNSLAASLSLPPPRPLRPTPGPFVELERISRGGTCTTAAYHDRGSGRVLCVKLCSKRAADEDDYVRGSLHRELQAYKAVALTPSAFVMQMHGAFQDLEYVYFAFDMMKCSLEDACSGQVAPAHHAQRWAAQISLGLQHLHDIGIIHRDLKPANILLSPGLDARVTDLGCAYVHARGPVRLGATYSREFLYTRGYCSPEMDDDDADGQTVAAYGPEVDWWGLGCVMYQMAAGVAPFEGECLRQYLAAEREGEGYIWLKEGLPEDTSRAGAEVIYGLLQLEPYLRWSYKQLYDHSYFDEDFAPGAPAPRTPAFAQARARAGSAAAQLYRPDAVRHRRMAEARACEGGRDLRASTAHALALYRRYDPASAAFYAPFAWVNERTLWAAEGLGLGALEEGAGEC